MADIKICQILYSCILLIVGVSSGGSTGGQDPPTYQGMSTFDSIKGIDFYSGDRKMAQGGVQFEILETEGIDFYSGVAIEKWLKGG